MHRFDLDNVAVRARHARAGSMPRSRWA
jgi:hypothetical protein